MISSVTRQKNILFVRRFRIARDWVMKLIFTSKVLFSALEQISSAAKHWDRRKKLGVRRAKPPSYEPPRDLGHTVCYKILSKDILGAVNQESIKYSSVLLRSVPATESFLDAMGLSM